MKLSKPQPRRDTEDYILPLVNIVFLLLIFFLLAGTFKAPDPLEIEPPQSRSEKQAETQGPLTVLLDAQGRLAIDGERLEGEALQQRLAERLAAEEGGVVRLKADAAVDAGRILEVMERLRSAGAQEITLLTALRTG